MAVDSGILDGVLDNEVPLTSGGDGPLVRGAAEADPLRIGIFDQSGNQGFAEPFNGDIDEVKFYDRALSSGEIGAGPIVVNVDATINGDPALGHTGVEVLLAAGSYEVTISSPSTETSACYWAWTPNASSPSWRTHYGVKDAGGTPVGGSQTTPCGGTPEEAFACSDPKTSFLQNCAAQEYEFFVTDNVLTDDVGGVSLVVTRLADPVPASSWLSRLALSAALIFVVLAGLRRRAVAPVRPPAADLSLPS